MNPTEPNEAFIAGGLRAYIVILFLQDSLQKLRLIAKEYCSGFEGFRVLGFRV